MKMSAMLPVKERGGLQKKRGVRRQGVSREKKGGVSREKEEGVSGEKEGGVSRVGELAMEGQH